MSAAVEQAKQAAFILQAQANISQYRNAARLGTSAAQGDDESPAHPTALARYSSGAGGSSSGRVIDDQVDGNDERRQRQARDSRVGSKRKRVIAYSDDDDE